MAEQILEAAPLAGTFRAPARARVLPSGRAASALAWSVVALITAGAAVLRLWRIGQVPLDPFYDAAVRSMGLSLHDFFFGAMEPGGGVSIDKPPVDLWLQVLSTKLVGFNATGLMLPEALIGTAAVPLLFAAVRRIWSTWAGLAAAVAIAVLPVEVITSRSDTMDAVMMTLTVLALLFIVRALERDSTRWLLLAAAALGLAFDVKVSESLIALPGLALFAFLGLPGGVLARLRRLFAAAAVYVLVALAWLLATLAFPAGERPFAYGSTTGSAWQASLVYNGLDRLEGKPTPGQSATVREPPGTPPPSQYARLSVTARERIPLRPPSPFRLFDRAGALAGERLGLLVLAALLLGLPALIAQLPARPRAPAAPAAQEDGPAATARAGRIRLAGLAGLVLWLLLGAALVSQMAHLHPRYTESFVPAAAGVSAIGLAWMTERSSRLRLVLLAVALGVLLGYSEQLLFGASRLWWLMAACAAAGLAAALAGLAGGTGRAGRAGRAAAAALLLGALAAIPLWASVRAVRRNVTDTNQLGVVRPAELAALSGFLRSHQGSAYYEAAYDSASKMGALVVHDARPILALNAVDSYVVTPLSKLQRLAAQGRVRYAIITSWCGPHTSHENADCSAAARWVVAHARNVSAQAGLGPRSALIWQLPSGRAALR